VGFDVGDFMRRGRCAARLAKKSKQKSVGAAVIRLEFKRRYRCFGVFLVLFM
jgi:hypothetical protein